MIITLFTDAGFCPKYFVGSWAIWAKESGKTLRKSGFFKENVQCNNEAEMQAIFNGLYYVQKIIKPIEDSKIILQTDSLDAITRFKSKTPVRVYENYRLLFQNKVKEMKIDIDVRYVPSHKGTATPRSAVNTWCDNQCRIELKKARLAVKTLF